MLSMVLSVFFILVVLSVLWLVWHSRYSFFFMRETSSPFECGFDSKDSGRMPFSLRFFTILVLFLMFDVELMFLLHLPMQIKVLWQDYWGYIMLYTFLVAGLYEEWRRSFIKWKA